MPPEVAINEAVVLAKRYATEEAGKPRERHPRAECSGRRRAMSAANESLQTAEELLERLRVKVDALEQLAARKATSTRRSTS